MPVVTTGLSPLLGYCPAHAHDIWEIVLNLQGEGRMVIGDREYPYGVGTIICQPPNVPHEKFSSGRFRDVYLQLTAFPLAAAPGTDGVIVLQDDAERSFATLLLMANRIYHRRDQNARNILQSLSDAMIQMLIGWRSQPPRSAVVEQLKNKIVDCFTDPEFSIDALLSDGPLCKDHLRRLFERETGVTPLGYLTTLRLDNARKLMQKNDVLHYPIAQIGAMSGFYDSGYFSRVFRKSTGLSPTEYLREQQNARKDGEL